MNLAKRDKSIQKMMIEVENKRQMLNNKYKSLHNAAADNELIKDVLEDYLAYYTTIKNEKLNQYNALSRTLDHVETMSDDPTLDENMIKYDHKEISKEMKRISKELELLEKNNI